MSSLRTAIMLFLALIVGASAVRAQEHREVHVIKRVGPDRASTIEVHTKGDTLYILRGDQGAIVYFEEDGGVVVQRMPAEEIMERMPPPERIERIEVRRRAPGEQQIWVEKEEEDVDLPALAGRWHQLPEALRERIESRMRGGEPSWMQPTPEEARALMDLLRQIRKLERESMELARRIRRGDVDDARKAEQKLEDLLGQIFDLKQRLLETRIQQLQNRLRTRNQERKAIIERRKQQLLGRDVIYQW